MRREPCCSPGASPSERQFRLAVDLRIPRRRRPLAWLIPNAAGRQRDTARGTVRRPDPGRDPAVTPPAASAPRALVALVLVGSSLLAGDARRSRRRGCRPTGTARPRAAYYEPLREWLRSATAATPAASRCPRPRTIGRPAYLAPSFGLARGWLRQLEMTRDDIFYERRPHPSSAIAAGCGANAVQLRRAARRPARLLGAGRAGADPQRPRLSASRAGPPRTGGSTRCDGPRLAGDRRRLERAGASSSSARTPSRSAYRVRGASSSASATRPSGRSAPGRPASARRATGRSCGSPGRPPCGRRSTSPPAASCKGCWAAETTAEVAAVFWAGCLTALSPSSPSSSSTPPGAGWTRPSARRTSASSSPPARTSRSTALCAPTQP